MNDEILSPCYCSECMIKHAGLVIYHSTYGDTPKALAHLHEALREAPAQDTELLDVVRKGGCTDTAARLEASWLLTTAINLRRIEVDGVTPGELLGAYATSLAARPERGVICCKGHENPACAHSTNRELLRIYIGEMLNGYLETQLALAIGVLSEYDNVPEMRDLRKNLVTAVLAYMAGNHIPLHDCMKRLDAVF